ncbi:MAG: 4-hydroxythreonine-4-phosphate dehydrogenase [Gammaproteobacteria bacterium]|nr:4-hydroxythreonine-4-phosphate dehydrogenase [Gammaproteobacteria bacterium]MBK81799.1 4-hydroxythreonine-4-phosphate dehydrogenase [Gammaproteobacteria bacterium]|tara:strand:+ start:25706 stop:26677 length:972 start_codon:yes stop_codon:yes gene_type:complete
MEEKPLIGITPGDPCGIGPEVVAKSLATGLPYASCRPVVIGSVAAVALGAEVAGADLKVRRIGDLSRAGREEGTVDVLDPDNLEASEIEPGVAKASCGRANAQWLQAATDLAMSGRIAASVMAPVNGEALARGGMTGGLPGTDPGSLYLTLLSGPLRVVHVFDHVPLEDVCRNLSQELVTTAIVRTAESLERWGIANPRVGVAGLNPHALGRQESASIEPGVAAAAAAGIAVEGPVAPDTVFRRCIEGRYDVVIAMFHDQGHIAIKTWGFEGNCAVFLGAPYLFLSVGHGTAYDIAGRGVADHRMMLSALLQAASLASGRGFC